MKPGVFYRCFAECGVSGVLWVFLVEGGVEQEDCLGKEEYRPDAGWFRVISSPSKIPRSSHRVSVF